MFTANPVKGYRREIANVQLEQCNPRTSMRVDDFNTPNSVITTTATDTGLENTVDLTYENNSCQHDCQQKFLSPSDNARRRVRSSGMINKDRYYTNSKQYLNSRNRSYEQNQYFHIRTGNHSEKPGSALTVDNIYQSNSVNHCELYRFTAPAPFEYIWIDNSRHTVTLPSGLYNIDTLNRYLHNAMDTQQHYYALLDSTRREYLLHLEYNAHTKFVSIISTANTLARFPNTKYIINQPWQTIYNRTPQLRVTLDIENCLGFPTGTYPDTGISSVDQTIVGTITAGITSSYVPIYYKPNNPQFGVQGAVSSGDVIARKKYDTITRVGDSFRTPFGSQTANAVAYGSSMYGYTIKDKYGYPTKKTPTFSKYSAEMKQCQLRKLANAI